MNCCEVCGVPNAELHHIVYRSQAPYMSNIKINFIYLCTEHHRGNLSPHMQYKVDLKYKEMLQDKLYEVFRDKRYFDIGEIKEKLKINDTEVKKLTKTLMVYKEGYKADEIIKHCMGDRFY